MKSSNLDYVRSDVQTTRAVNQALHAATQNPQQLNNSLCCNLGDEAIDEADDDEHSMARRP